ncbi:MAG: DinB family protein [Dehalococcoidia bacterium]
MKATEFAVNSINGALGFLDMCVSDVNDDVYNLEPAGTCNSIAKVHLHALSTFDFFVNGLISGQPLIWQEHAAKMGLPGTPLEIWKADTPISKSAVEEYASKLRPRVSEQLAGLGDDIFTREFDTTLAGKQNGAWVLSLLPMHTSAHAGEIAAIKGTQGLKGLPF